MLLSILHNEFYVLGHYLDSPSDYSMWVKLIKTRYLLISISFVLPTAQAKKTVNRVDRTGPIAIKFCLKECKCNIGASLIERLAESFRRTKQINF